jgi:hypothetical protein
MQEQVSAAIVADRLQEAKQWRIARTSTPRANTAPVHKRASQMLRRLFSTIVGRGNAPVADHPVAILVGGRSTTRIADLEAAREPTGCTAA